MTPDREWVRREIAKVERHSVEVAEGVITPGQNPPEGAYCAAGCTDSLNIPPDLSGARYMEIETYDGPPAFEAFEQIPQVLRPHGLVYFEVSGWARATTGRPATGRQSRAGCPTLALRSSLSRNGTWRATGMSPASSAARRSYGSPRANTTSTTPTRPSTPSASPSTRDGTASVFTEPRTVELVLRLDPIR